MFGDVMLGRVRGYRSQDRDVRSEHPYLLTRPTSGHLRRFLGYLKDLGQACPCLALHGSTNSAHFHSGSGPDHSSNFGGSLSSPGIATGRGIFGMLARWSESLRGAFSTLTSNGSMTPEQSQVLELLAHWTRLLSVQQVSELFLDHKNPARSARSLVKRLVQQGLVQERTLMARPSVSVEPLLTFRKGDAEPDFKALSRSCRSRWTEPAQAINVIQLSLTGAKAYGVLRSRTIRASEATHDLQMAQVTLSFYRSGLVRKWIRDDVLAKNKRWGVVPDAEAHFQSGERLVVECGGSYSAKKLAAFHAAVTTSMEGLGVNAYQIF